MECGTYTCTCRVVYREGNWLFTQIVSVGFQNKRNRSVNYMTIYWLPTWCTNYYLFI